MDLVSGQNTVLVIWLRFTMLATRALLLSLCVFIVNGQSNDNIYITYDDNDYTTDPPFVVDFGDWLIDLLHDNNVCDPNPCFNGGSCQRKSDTEFQCLCKEPYVGKACQKVRNVCENVKCGFGSCVMDMSRPPYYRCKCRPPYSGPDCKTKPNSPCNPNPCQHGAGCIATGLRRFYCACPVGYTGKFCETVPGDCYIRNGETYRGVASITEDGEDCLDWNDYFVVARVGDPFMRFADFDGLEDNNHCRNPDGDVRPWCYIKQGGRLAYNYCRVRKCLEPVTTPTVINPDPAPAPTAPPRPSTHFSQCGIGKPIKTSRIFGGSKAFPGSNPWQASVQARYRGSNQNFFHICGGILISSCWVLTAGHCIDQAKEYQVVLGGINILKQEDMDQTIPVINTYVHENYRETRASVHNDIALLKLKVTDDHLCAKETAFVKTACLPDQAFPAGKECVISGWGATETQSYSSQLMSTNVFLISHEKCRAPHVYGRILDDSMFCAGLLQGGIDSCQGDSGGPLVCADNGTQYITGVVSWGHGCAQKNKPGVYANVLQFKDWIINKMA